MLTISGSGRGLVQEEAPAAAAQGALPGLLELQHLSLSAAWHSFRTLYSSFTSNKSAECQTRVSNELPSEKSRRTVSDCCGSCVAQPALGIVFRVQEEGTAWVGVSTRIPSSLAGSM